MITTTEWIETQLDQAIDDYLKWMADSGYANSTREAYARDLNRFGRFVKQIKCPFDAIFTEDTLRQFKETGKPYRAVYGLSRFLFDQGKVPRPLTAKHPLTKLPEIYEDYLVYYQQQKGAWADGDTRQNRRVLCALHDYLQKERIDLARLTIEPVDAFWPNFLRPSNPLPKGPIAQSCADF